MKLHKITFLLLVIGGLNWLLVGAIGWDVGMLFGGQGAMISRVVYILVGLSALHQVFGHKSTCKECTTTKPASMPM
jgi:uncharacterized membrane protein YuzA (DUF378 family)